MTRKYSSTSVETTLASGINTTQTTMTVPSSTAATLLLGGQTLAAGNVDIFTVVIDPDTVNEEVVFVTNVSGDTLTISRGQAGTGTAGVSGIAHSAGATVRHSLTSSDLDFFRNGVATADAAIPKSLVDAKGDLIVATADNTPARLAVGTVNGQALTVNSATASGLAWTTISSAPKIGQVISTNFTTGTSTTSTSFVDISGATATITPTSATSKILILCDFRLVLQGLFGANSGGALLASYTQLARSTTNIGPQTETLMYSNSLGSSDLSVIQRVPLTFLDSPATTSATTYKLQIRSNGSSISTSAGVGSITLLEVLV